MAAVGQSTQSQHSYSPVKSGHVFSDDELSEIFQIDFGLIFGNPEDGLKSNYKGLQHKKTAKGKLCVKSGFQTFQSFSMLTSNTTPGNHKLTF